jgi:geranylgeranyl diphosphate synthase type I
MYLESFISEASKAIDYEIQSILKEEIGNDSKILSDIFTNHFGWEEGNKRNGKKIRPNLLLLVSYASGGNWQKAVPAAAAIEIIHNYSLIHDDIEDGDKKRHGRSTAWVTFGVPQAINAGDALLAAGISATQRLKSFYPLETVNEVQNRLTKAVLSLTIGQSLDLQYAKEEIISVDDYEQMIKNKTANLIEESVVLGGILGGMRQEHINKMQKFGHCVGMAFQIKDDWLGIWGDENLTGKSTSNDLLSNKKSLPIVYGLKLKKDFYHFWQSGKIKKSNLNTAVKLLEKDGTRQFVEEIEEHWKNKAKSVIAPLMGIYPEMEHVLNYSEILTDRKR